MPHDIRKRRGEHLTNIKNVLWCNSVFMKKSGQNQIDFERFRRYMCLCVLQECYQDIERHKDDSKEQLEEYERLHCSVSRGKRMLIEMEPSKFVGCVLHLLLSVVGTLWEHSICVHLQGSTGKKRTDELNAVLASLHIHA